MRGQRSARVGIAPLVLLAGSIAGVTYLITAGHAQPAFSASARQVATPESCLSTVALLYGMGPGNGQDACAAAEGSAWFDVTITNTGHVEGFALSCAVRGIGSDGRPVLTGEMNVAWTQFPQGQHVQPGETKTFRWFVAGVSPELAGTASRFEVDCPAVDGEHVPF
jgi:hypothetical protein